MVRACARVLGAVVVLASAPHARADDIGAPIEPSDEKVRLVYTAPPGCPERAVLIEGVRTRIGEAWEAPEGDLARQIDVRVESRGGRFVATVEFLDGDGNRVTRSVGGEHCENVVNGISLVTALAIESRVDEVLDQSEPAAPPSEAAPAEAPRRPELRAPALPAQPSRAPWGAVRAGVRGSGVTAVGPEPSFGAGFFGGLEWGALRVGLALDIVRSPNVTRNGIPADYTLASGRLEGGVGFWPAGALGLEAAAFFEAGALTAETTNQQRVVTQGRGSAPFAAPGVLGRVVTFVDPLIAELELMARRPLVREKFGVDVGGVPQPAYRVRPFSAGAALGIGVRF